MSPKMVYANLVRTYDGEPTLYAAARKRDSVTIRTDVNFGNGRGFWGGSPIREIASEPGIVLPEVAAVARPTERTVDNPVPTIFDLIVQAVEKAWRPDAFHLVFQSSGWDTRIIAAAIKRLLGIHGPEWLGEGLLFLSNRWEAPRFTKLMQAMGWADHQYASLDEGDALEHFAKPVYDMWKFAPFPRPGNFFWYLQEWAEGVGLLPEDNVQAFSGLWANEVWYWMFPQVEWVPRAERKYCIHMIASLPIKAQWVEYPLVCLPVMDALRRAKTAENRTNGNEMRRAVAMYACPEGLKVRRSNFNDGYHQLSPRLRNELDDYYSTTEYGRQVPWVVPEHSGNSADWGKWGMALLMEELMIEGIGCRLA